VCEPNGLHISVFYMYKNYYCEIMNGARAHRSWCRGYLHQEG